MDVKFYKCMHCGNIAVKVFDAGVPLVCSGEKMVELVADSQDAALEKHVPAVEVEGNKVIVNVGSVDHPMLEEHWLQFICLVTDKGYQIHPLAQQGQGDKVVHHGVFQRLVDHGVAAVFDDHGFAMVLLDIRGGLRKKPRHFFVFHLFRAPVRFCNRR